GNRRVRVETCLDRIEPLLEPIHCSRLGLRFRAPLHRCIRKAFRDNAGQALRHELGVIVRPVSTRATILQLRHDLVDAGGGDFAEPLLEPFGGPLISHASPPWRSFPPWLHQQACPSSGPALSLPAPLSDRGCSPPDKR